MHEKYRDCLVVSRDLYQTTRQLANNNSKKLLVNLRTCIKFPQLFHRESERERVDDFLVSFIW